MRRSILYMLADCSTLLCLSALCLSLSCMVCDEPMLPEPGTYTVTSADSAPFLEGATVYASLEGVLISYQVDGQEYSAVYDVEE